MPNTISESAVLGTGTRVGEYTVIMDDVRVGADCQVGHHVVIHPGTVIGDSAQIDDHAVLGKPPLRSRAMALPEAQDLPALVLADNVLIGTAAIVYRGARLESGVLIGDSASVREESVVGENSIIGRSVVIENKVTVGRACKIETGAFIAAVSEIGNGCFVAPEVTVTNDNYMGRTEERKKHFKGISLKDGARIGANATLLPGITFQRDGVAAAGAVVTRDVLAREIVAGIPARILREVPQDQLLENR